MNEKPIISVIMPIYNAASFLSFTMKNIVEQQFGNMDNHDWELIVVDDGSTDGSHLEIEPWVTRFPKSIRLIRTKNQGVSTARNTGLHAAHGEYVYFIDSDDILLCNSLAELLKFAETKNPDVIKFLFHHVSSEEYAEQKLDVAASNLKEDDFKLFTCKEFLKETEGLVYPMIHTSTWQTIFRRQILIDNNLGYSVSLTIGEDEEMTWSTIPYVQTVLYTPAELLLYHQRHGSASHPMSTEAMERYQMERIKFAGEMIDRLNIVKSSGLMDDKTFAAIFRKYQYCYYHSVVDLIVMNYPLSTIHRAMKLYRSYGGDVHPGRPRFIPFYEKSKISFAAKVRRFIVAYFIAFFTQIGL